MLSGPAALWGFKSFKSDSILSVSTLTGGIFFVLLGPKSGRSVISSTVKTVKLVTHDVHLVLSIAKGQPILFKGTILGVSFFFVVIKVHYLL